jgi:hypothetical protein
MRKMLHKIAKVMAIATPFIAAILCAANAAFTQDYTEALAWFATACFSAIVAREYIEEKGKE